MNFDWNKWREDYLSMNWEQQLAYYEDIWKQYPVQQSYSRIASIAFFNYVASMGGSGNIIELGGWQGHLARDVWNLLSPDIVWHNYEVCKSAVDNPVIYDNRYKGIVPIDFLWNYPAEHFKQYNTFVASHSIEHITFDNFKCLIDKLDSIQYIYLDIPIEQIIKPDWDNYIGTHILDASWQDIVSVLNSHGYKEISELTNYERISVRCFSKALKQIYREETKQNG